MNIEQLDNELTGASELTGCWAITNDGVTYRLKNSPYEVVMYSALRGTTDVDNLVVLRDPQRDEQILSATTDDRFVRTIRNCELFPHDLIFYGDVVR